MDTTTSQADVSLPSASNHDVHLQWLIPITVCFVLIAILFVLLTWREQLRIKEFRSMTHLLEESLRMIKGKGYRKGHSDWKVPENCGKYAIRSNYLRKTIDSLRDNDNEGFVHQFSQELPLALTGLRPSSEVAKREENLEKNRFKNVIPYDKTRVILTTIEDDPSTDYINANYVDCYDIPKKYIATQGPKTSTIKDFWRMVWQRECGVIVMLVNLIETGKKKCEQYWPEPNQPIAYGTIQVTLLKVKEFDDYIIRQFTIVNDEIRRKVTQLHYTSWPDHGVPSLTSSIIRFNEKVTDAFEASVQRGSIVVHCSAGVGRTGTFIAFNSLIRELNYKLSVNVFDTVLNMRKQRIAMVQTARQYIFLHYLITEVSELGNTDYQATDFKSMIASLEKLNGNGRSGLDEEFDKLISLDGLDTSQSIAYEGSNSFKISATGIFPYDHSLVSMLRLKDGSKSFYNASYIKGYQKSPRLIAAQGALAHTVKDFWHSVLSNNVQVIVMLTSFQEEKEKCYVQYWPENVGDKSEHEHITVTFDKKEELSDQLIRRDFSIKSPEIGIENQRVTQLHFQAWSETSTPSKGTEILELVKKAKEFTEESGAIFVHCGDGTNRTGVFLAILNLIERVKVEGKIDVLRSVKDLREMRPYMVKTAKLYKFIYQVMSDYISTNKLDNAPKTELWNEREL